MNFHGPLSRPSGWVPGEWSERHCGPFAAGRWDRTEKVRLGDDLVRVAKRGRWVSVGRIDGGGLALGHTATGAPEIIDG